METLKNHVKELRGSMGMTQSELAELVGVTRQTIISLEKGSYVPSLLLAMKLSEALQSSMEEIFFKETIL